MKVVWSRRALRHLIALRRHIEKDSEQNAALVASPFSKPLTFFKAIRKLAGLAASSERANWWRLKLPMSSRTGSVDSGWN